MKYIGRAQMAKLPASMRGPLLQIMYENMLDAFPFVREGMSTPAVNTLLMRLNPLVALRGMGLIEPKSLSNQLFCLHKGCLRIALPVEKG